MDEAISEGWISCGLLFCFVTGESFGVLLGVHLK